MRLKVYTLREGKLEYYNKFKEAQEAVLKEAWQDASKEFGDLYAALRLLLPATAIKFLFRR